MVRGMNPLSPLVKGAQVAEAVTVTAIRVAFAAPKLLANLLGYREDENGATARPYPVQTRPPTAPGGTGRRPPGPDATPGRAGTAEGSVEVTGAPPEPTSAAGASGG